MTTSPRFSGYKWSGLSAFAEDSDWHRHLLAFSQSINWDALCKHASDLHHGMECTLDTPTGLRGRYMVRILRFQDGDCWIARLRMHDGDMSPERVDADSRNAANALLQREVDCIRLVKERTTVPVPAVFGFILDNSDNDVGAPVMFMECLSSNVGMDLNSSFIPSELKASFCEDMARYQVRSLLFVLGKSTFDITTRLSVGNRQKSHCYCSPKLDPSFAEKTVLTMSAPFRDSAYRSKRQRNISGHRRQQRSSLAARNRSSKPLVEILPPKLRRRP